MREIKFRGKDIDQGKWRCGNFAKIIESNGSLTHYIIDEQNQQWFVFAESVGQYTGIKDIKGKEIYEGDILRCVTEDYGEDYITKVYAVGNTLCVDVSGEDYDYTSIDFAEENVWENYNYDIEIIGNIHENPELLEDSK